MIGVHASAMRATKAADVEPGDAFFEATNNAIFNQDFGAPLSVALWMGGATGSIGGTAYCLAGKINPTAPDRGWNVYFAGFASHPGFMMAHAYPSSYLLVEVDGPALSPGEWHHVCFTYDGSSTHAGIKAYVDGVARTTTPFGPGVGGGATMINTRAVTFGARRDASGTGIDSGLPKWIRRLHDFAIWNVELTPTQVLDVYGAGRVRGKVPPLERNGGQWPAPLAYWAARSGDGPGIPERMGTGQHMTVQGAATLVAR